MEIIGHDCQRQAEWVVLNINVSFNNNWVYRNNVLV